MNMKMTSKMNETIVFAVFTICLSTVAAEQLKSTRVSCLNEGELVTLDHIDTHRCFSCICKNGYVECSSDCPKTDECSLVVQEKCCKRCKGCNHNGANYSSHTEWSSPSDPCTVYRCEAGIITVSNIECYTPCVNPLPPEPGKCCPTCPQCSLNGQIAAEDRDVTPDDPCLKCRCNNRKLVCAKKACPVLQCNKWMQYQPPGECCPKCNGSKKYYMPKNSCILQSSLLKNGEKKTIDNCTNCTCISDTSVCKRSTCPILDCSPEYQTPVAGSCCRKCSSTIEESRSTCSYSGKLYEDGEKWQLDSCKSCMCHQGKISCAMTRCNNTSCAPGLRAVKQKGECCSKCVEVDGACMAFGDPHYKTFDGKMYNFKGIGRYQLTADCENGTFSIKVANFNTKGSASSSTKRVAIRFMDVRLNLQQKGRVKCNGNRVTLPYKMEGKFRAQKIKDNVEIVLSNDVRILWNGRTFVEVVVPATYKNKVCGLCGNFNDDVKDDLKTKTGRIVTDKEILSFGASWCVGKKTECDKKIRSTINRPAISSLTATSPVSFHQPLLKKKVCKLGGISRSNILEPCESKLSFDRYYKACKMDMTVCHNNKCYCEILLAYTRECERLGVELSNWQKQTGCDPSNFKRNKHKKMVQLHRSHRQKMSRKDDLLRMMSTSNFNSFSNLTKTRIPIQFSRPPPPIPIE